jgi:hypothetical protein
MRLLKTINLTLKQKIMNLISFEECINIASESTGNNHLLLGNGFSVALFPQIFNYNRLTDSIRDQGIKKLFKEFKTPDFEFVMFKLIECLRVLDYYDKDSSLYKTIFNDIEKLKEILITVITNNHPTNPKSITEEQYNSCYEFLKNFRSGRIYTFNYDLLLYWVFMHFIDSDDMKLKLDDGFRTNDENDSMVSWEIGREINQNLYYIHGAMHLFKDKSAVIEKFNWKNTGICIADQVRSAVDNQKLPIFISEGSTEHKLKRITENGYLSRAMASIKNIGGNLFIFGHSLRDEDDHVFNLILENKKLKNIFISVYGDLQSELNKHIIRKIDNWKQNNIKSSIYLFDSQSAKVWDRF